jgi:hypothetical protein
MSAPGTPSDGPADFDVGLAQRSRDPAVPLAPLRAPDGGRAGRLQTDQGRAAHAEAILAILKARADAAGGRSGIMLRKPRPPFAGPDDQCSERVDPP